MGLKKIFISLFLFVSVYSFGQQVQFPFTYGLGYARTGADTLLWIPSDTLRPTTQLIGRTHLARKGTTVYYWNGSLWVTLSGGASTLQQVFNTEIGGSALTKMDTINVGSSATDWLRIIGSGSTLNLQVINTGSGKAINGSSVSGNAIEGNTTSGFGLRGTTISGSAALELSTGASSGSDIANVANFYSQSQSTVGSNGIGGQIIFGAESSTTVFATAARLQWYYPAATHASRTTYINWLAYDAGTEKNVMQVQPGVVLVNNLADTLATKAYARSVGGGGTGTLSRIGAIDSLAKAANGSQISGVSIINQSADSVNVGLLKSIDYSRSFKLKTENNPTGTLTMNLDSAGQRMYYFTSTGGRTLAFSNLRRGDIAVITFDNTSGADITLTLPSNSYVNYVSSATATIPANKSSLSLSTYDGVNYWFIQSIAGGAVAGLNKQIQYNNSGSIAGASGFEYQSGASPNVSITAQNAAHTALTVNGAASQSTGILDVRTSGGANTGVKVDAGGGMQVFGTLSAPTGSGAIELLYSGGVGTIQSFNRAGSYMPLTIDGNIKLNNSGSTRVTVGVQGIYVSTGTSTPTAKVHIGAGTATANTAPLKFTLGPFLTTAEAGAMEYDSLKLTFTNEAAIRQQIPLIQQSRVTSQFDKTSSAALSDITGLTGTLAAGRTYRFDAKLYTTSNSAGGVQFAIGGTCSATAIIYEGLTTNAGTITQSRTTTKGNAVGAVTAVTAAYTVITGTITVNAAGTLTVQFAQNVSNGTASSVLVGSTFVITQML